MKYRSLKHCKKITVENLAIGKILGELLVQQ